MKKLFLYLIIMLITLNFSCSSNIGTSNDLSDEINCQTIEVGSLLPEVQNEAVLKDHHYIPLETRNESIIGQIAKIKIYEGKIFILDNDVAKALFVFDKNGKYLYKIKSSGRGPGEVLDLRDFDFYDGKLFVLDFEKVLIFDLDGNFQKEIDMEWPAENISVLDENHIYLFLNGHLTKTKFPDNQIIKTDLNLRKHDQFLPTIRKEISLGTRFQKFDGKVFFTSPQYGEYSIYELTDNGLSCSYYFDFGDRNFGSDARQIQKTIELLKQTNNFNLLRSVYLDEDFIFFTFIGNRFLHTGFKFSNSEKPILGKSFPNLFEEPFMLPLVYTIENNRLYIPLEANRIVRSDIDNNYLKLYPSFFELRKHLSETDNPVIATFRIDNPNLQ